MSGCQLCGRDTTQAWPHVVKDSKLEELVFFDLDQLSEAIGNGCRPCALLQAGLQLFLTLKPSPKDEDQHIGRYTRIEKGLVLQLIYEEPPRETNLLFLDSDGELILCLALLNPPQNVDYHQPTMRVSFKAHPATLVHLCSGRKSSCSAAYQNTDSARTPPCRLFRLESLI